MNILVTGGAGFIGSHLVDELLKRGHTVHIIDNFHDNYNPQIKMDNIANALLSPLCCLHKTDIRDLEQLAFIFDSNKFDLVVHIAALAGVRNSIAHEELYYNVNVMGTRNILECCRKAGINKFIFASSSSVYGNNKTLPFSENQSVDFPISPYAATKKACELLCHSYHHLYDIACICLRFFTVYGPRQRPDLAIHKFTKLMTANMKLQIYGDGSSARDYTYIDDIVKGITASIDYVNKNKCYQIINLGESKTISLMDMLKTLKDVTGIDPDYEFIPDQPGDVNITFADISKANKLLDYYPDTSFAHGIKLFWKWYKNYYNIK